MRNTSAFPYIKLCAAAAIPAILYYVAIFTAVHFEAVRTGLKGAAPDENAKSWQWLLLHKGYLSAPIFVILITMILGFSAYKAALYGILSIVIIMFAEKRGRIDWQRARQNARPPAAGMLFLSQSPARRPVSS